jgi:hypothetical protein
VQVGDHIQGIEVILQFCPVAHCADVVAQRKGAGGLDARKNAFSAFGRFTHFIFLLVPDARVLGKIKNVPDRTDCKQSILPRTNKSMIIRGATLIHSA